MASRSPSLSSPSLPNACVSFPPKPAPSSMGEEKEALSGDLSEEEDGEAPWQCTEPTSRSHECEGAPPPHFRRSHFRRSLTAAVELGSPSLRRHLKWYQRPSPRWFVPGTLLMSLSMGVTISPRVEIYYKLICRVMGPEESGTTLPPPQTEVRLRPQSSIADQPLPSSSPPSAQHDVVGHVVQQANTSSMGLPIFRFEVIPTTEDSWTQQCHKSPNCRRPSRLSYVTSPSLPRVREC